MIRQVDAEALHSEWRLIQAPRDRHSTASLDPWEVLRLRILSRLRLLTSLAAGSCPNLDMAEWEPSNPATGTRPDRDVVLKALPPAFPQD